LKHPCFEVNPVGDVDDTMIDVVRKLAESVKADEFGGAFDKFLARSCQFVPRATTMS
jgi:hypothetical protein